jgi:hypothetical protein
MATDKKPSLDEVRQKAELQRQQKEYKLRTTSFEELKAKGKNEKMDLLWADTTKLQENFTQINKTVTEEYRTINAFINLMAKKLIEVEVFASMDEFKKAYEESVDEEFERRSFTETDTVDWQDEVVVSIIGYENDIPQLLVSKQFLTLQLKTFFPSLEKAFIGMKVGELKKTDIQYPNPYAPAPDKQGKTYKFDLTVHSAKRNLKAEEQKKLKTAKEMIALSEKAKELGIEVQSSWTLQDLRTKVIEAVSKKNQGAKVEAPAVETPKVETPVIETPKVEPIVAKPEVPAANTAVTEELTVDATTIERKKLISTYESLTGVTLDSSFSLDELRKKVRLASEAPQNTSGVGGSKVVQSFEGYTAEPSSHPEAQV